MHHHCVVLSPKQHVHIQGLLRQDSYWFVSFPIKPVLTSLLCIRVINLESASHQLHLSGSGTAFCPAWISAVMAGWRSISLHNYHFD